MIFVTVGTELPFDRLVKQIDQWALSSGRTDVFAQIGEGGWRPEHIAHSEFLEPPEFLERFASASLIIGHAGMGTILSALRHGKPILVMPRKATLGEQRNEHQLATARYLSQMGKISVAFDEHELTKALHALDSLTARGRITSHASPELCAAVSSFIGGYRARSASFPASMAVRPQVPEASVGGTNLDESGVASSETEAHIEDRSGTSMSAGERELAEAARS